MYPVAVQAADDPSLLALMLDDLQVAPQQYQPTNYWLHYQRPLLDYLSTSGLHGFRRCRGGPGGAALAAMGAVDLIEPICTCWPAQSRLLQNRFTGRIPGWTSVVTRVATRLNPPRAIPRVDLEAYRCLCYEFTRQQGARAAFARPLEAFSASLVGDPEDAFEINGSTYTTSMLKYYLRYAYVSRFLDFSSISTMVELGPGLGKQAELIHALHPHITMLLFDIPPQSYLSNQYLSSAFPGDVIGYREARDLTDLSEIPPGKIVSFGNRQFPILEGASLDLFWNEASLQEMEPDVVAMYLEGVQRNCRYAYLLEAMDGKEVARRAGQPGVLRQTTLVHYEKSLSSFVMEASEPPLLPTGRTTSHFGYAESFWHRVDRE